MLLVLMNFEALRALMRDRSSQLVIELQMQGSSSMGANSFWSCALPRFGLWNMRTASICECCHGEGSPFDHAGDYKLHQLPSTEAFFDMKLSLVLRFFSLAWLTNSVPCTFCHICWALPWPFPVCARPKRRQEASSPCCFGVRASWSSFKITCS